MSENLFEDAGRIFFSRNRIKELEAEIATAGVTMPADSFAGYVGINVIILTIVLTLLALIFPPSNAFLTEFVSAYIQLPFPLIALMVLIVSFVFVYLATMALLSTYLLMNAENRRRNLEVSLPDFLTLVASNIKAGMTLDQAMWYSAKPEFGVLTQEVKNNIRSSFSGESLEDTLDHLGSRFDSKVFKRTILLLKQATATGGELTEVLEQTADDVRNTLIMKKEIAANLVMYEIFVFIGAVIGTPFLFAVTYKFIQVFEKIAPQTGTTDTFTQFSNIAISGPAISSSDFFWFSIPTIFVTSLISSFMMSVIRTGTRNSGMKYFPFMLVLSYIIYWVIISFVESFFATIG